MNNDIARNINAEIYFLLKIEATCFGLLVKQCFFKNKFHLSSKINLAQNRKEGKNEYFV